MSDIDTHQAFREAHAFVEQYFEQLGRLLLNGREALEQRGFRMLRSNGDRYVSSVDTVTTEPGQWLTSWLFAFFAPASAFEGRVYGVPARSVKRVLFLACGSGGLPDCPAIWLGWIEGYDREGNLESKLQGFYDAIDPPSLVPEPQPVASLDAITLVPASAPESPLRITMFRVPMKLITGRNDVITLIDKLVEHVKR